MIGRWMEVDPDYPGICIVANQIVDEAFVVSRPPPYDQDAETQRVIDRLLWFFDGGRFPHWRRKPDTA